MQLSEQTIEILKNFYQINPSMLFKPGNVVSSYSPQQTLLGYATVPETFSKEAAVLDLRCVLDVLQFLNDAQLEFGDDRLYIRTQKETVQYTYTRADLITVSPYKKLVKAFSDDNVVGSFDLTKEMLSNIIKGANILQLPAIEIVGEDDQLLLRAVDPENQTTDSYQSVVGTTQNEFCFRMKVEELRFLPRDYNVSVSGSGFIQFESQLNDLELFYWVASEADQ